MSVRASADEKVYNAAEHVADAIVALFDVCYQECGGFDDYPDEYKRELKSAFQVLLQAKELINRPLR